MKTTLVSTTSPALRMSQLIVYLIIIYLFLGLLNVFSSSKLKRMTHSFNISLSDSIDSTKICTVDSEKFCPAHRLDTNKHDVSFPTFSQRFFLSILKQLSHQSVDLRSI
jgi:hypothetical protein